MRVNDEGIRRDELPFYLTRADLIARARAMDACLLCRRPRVNEAALCLVCWSSLDEDEVRQAARWTAGLEP